MNKHLLTLLMLFPLILAACDGGDDDNGSSGGDGGQEQACIDAINPENVLQRYPLELEATFESGVTYMFPSTWTLREISETQHELRLPQVPPVVIRIVDTEELRALGLPESVTTNEADFDLYTSTFYPGQQKLGFSGGTALDQTFGDGQFRLPCDGEAHIRLFNNVQGRIMAIDLRSESGAVPQQFHTLRGDLWRSLAGL